MRSGLNTRMLALALILLVHTAEGALARHLTPRVPSNNILKRQTGSLADCRYVYGGDIFSTCQKYLWTFDITLDYFRAQNPGISETCDNYVPGERYCLIRCKSPQFVCEKEQY
jgi:hypothetical protein